MAGPNVAELIRGALACVAPPRCPGCDGRCPVEGAVHRFCDACAPLLEPAPGSLRPPARIAAAHSYGGPIADAIAKLKYAGRTDIVAPLGQLLAQAALAYAGSVELVVPMPLFARRLRERGFNQSALLGAYAARALGVELATDRLRRVRDTAAQAGLSRAARAANVRAAFAARAVSASVLLVDDVRTTGATLAAAADALRAAGATEVVTLALAAAAR